MAARLRRRSSPRGRRGGGGRGDDRWGYELTVSVEEREGARLITLRRPEKLNALTLEMVRALRDHLSDAARDRAVRLVVIAAEGASFSAGVDLHEFAGGDTAGGLNLIETLKDLCAEARNAPKVVACAVRGHCLGGAFELAMASDFRVCTPDARFGLPEVGVGLPSVIDAALLAHYVGLGRAREMLLTGDSVDAATALDWGLVNRVTDGDPVEAAIELGRAASRHHPAVIRAQKELIDDWLNQPLQESIDASVNFLADAFREGIPQRRAAELLDRGGPSERG